MDMLEGPVGITAKGAVVEHPLHVEQCRLLTRLDGNPEAGAVATLIACRLAGLSARKVAALPKHIYGFTS